MAEHMTPTDIRLQLHRNGYAPLPLIGKAPVLKNWQQKTETNPQEIALWSSMFPDADNTGALTPLQPTLDIDICNEEAARGAEEIVRAHHEAHGLVLVRIGKPPKRAIPFRTNEPFKKIQVGLIAPNGSEEKIEFLGDGQQVAVAGLHPDTKQPYRWHGGELWQTPRDELPYIREAEARALIDKIVEMLCREFGYRRAAARPKPRKGNGHDATRGAEDWQFLFDNVREGRALHDSLRDLAAKLIKSGTSGGAAVNQLRALMQAAPAPHDARWQERYDDIPRLVESAEQRFREPPEPEPASITPGTIDETLQVFKRWLVLDDLTPVYAVLGAVAANLLEGDPVWLGVIGPPSSAKTEILNSISTLPNVVQSATVTVAGLLSGTPKKQQDGAAKGGLLRQIGDFGIIALKDFTSILSMHTETRAEVLAALREIYDGAWTRHIGSDGGRTLDWKGKVGLVFACTAALDTHYGVIGSMGDRFLLTRLMPAGKQQFKRALVHVGPKSKQMRKDLAEAVARLFAGRRTEPRPISDKEAKEIEDTILLAVRLRGTVERDRRNYEIENIPGAEGPARIGLALERLLAGLDTLGVERATALEVVKNVALDSVPPNRRRAYEFLDNIAPAKGSTTSVANKLGLPTNTARRILEDLTAYGLTERISQGQGQPDNWARLAWEE
jgi:hypothetical protein